MSVVDVEQQGSVRTITLADEERRNALSADLVSGLVAACDDADADPSVRVVVLTNRGTTFCAGAEPPAAVRNPALLFGRFRQSPKPYVGRIAGHCVAGGMGLAAAMDISVAVETARFGFTEVRIGVAPAVISVVCLPKLRAVDARAAFLRVWPLGKFPVLRDEAKGLTIPESTTIIEYLAEHHPGPSELVPADADRARETRFRDRFYDLYVHEPMQKIVTDKLRPAGRSDPHGVEQARALLQTAYAAIDPGG